MMLQYRIWPTNSELLVQNFLHVQVILGHKRPIELYVYTSRPKSLNLQITSLLILWPTTAQDNYFNMIVFSLIHTLNKKLKLKGAALHMWLEGHPLGPFCDNNAFFVKETTRNTAIE